MYKEGVGPAGDQRSNDSPRGSILLSAEILSPGVRAGEGHHTYTPHTTAYSSDTLEDLLMYSRLVLLQ